MNFYFCEFILFVKIAPIRMVTKKIKGKIYNQIFFM